MFSTILGLWLFLYINIAAKYASTAECSVLVMLLLSAFCKILLTTPFTLSLLQKSSGLVAIIQVPMLDLGNLLVPDFSHNFLIDKINNA